MHLQSKRLGIFADDGGGEEKWHVKHTLGSECLVEFAAVSGQRADAASFVLIVEQNLQVAGDSLSASIVGEQRQCLLHRIALECLDTLCDISRGCISGFIHVQQFLF